MYLLFTMQTAGGNLFDILLNIDMDLISQISTGPSFIPITKYCLRTRNRINNCKIYNIMNVYYILQLILFG